MRTIALGKIPSAARKRIEALLNPPTRERDRAPVSIDGEEPGPPDSTEARMFAEALERGQRGKARMQGVVATPIPCERCGADTRDYWALIGRGAICRRVCVSCAPAEFDEQEP